MFATRIKCVLQLFAILFLFLLPLPLLMHVRACARAFARVYESECAKASIVVQRLFVIHVDKYYYIKTLCQQRTMQKIQRTNVVFCM